MNKLINFARRIIHRDPMARFSILRLLGRWIMPEYRFKWPQMAWWDDVQFNNYLKRFNELDGLNTDRRWMLYQLMHLVEKVPGDTAECGAFVGTSSYVICRMNNKATTYQRIHHIFDSFDGLSEPSMLDGTYWSKGNLSATLEIMMKNLSEFDNINVHKGWIPERFPDVENLKFCFVHIDVDLYQPTLDSIEFFYPRVNEGGIILCDDYGFTTCPGATKAIDQFLEDKCERMISLSCGGGFLIKGRSQHDLIDNVRISVDREKAPSISRA